MSKDTSIMVSLGDPKAKEIAEIIGNKTANKILDYLARGDKTVSEISRDLNIAINTVDYNIKKLLKADLIEKADSWWSVKGKKMPTYKVTNQKIVISPRRSPILSFLIVLGLIGVAALLVGQTYGNNYSAIETNSNKMSDEVLSSGAPTEEINQDNLDVGSRTSATANLEGEQIGEDAVILEDKRSSEDVEGIPLNEYSFFEEPWFWFLIGAFTTLILIYIVNLINNRGQKL